MHTKIRSAKFKAVGGSKPGTFSAVVAVYGNVDSVGDRIIEGAFDQSLKAWQALGDPIPIVLAHEWKDPFKHIGYAMPNKIKSVPGVGLVVEEGFLDVEDNPLAKQVHRLMERRTLKEFSFGYGIPQGGQTKASDGAMDLRMLDLIEFGPCLKGVNDKTELLSIKSQLTHEGVYVPNFEERLERIEEMLMEDTKAASAGRARWRSQKRHPETGKWIDETAGPGFDGKPRSQNTRYGAQQIDDTRKTVNAHSSLPGSDKYAANQLLNEAEAHFLEGRNKEGEQKVETAKKVLRDYSSTPVDKRSGDNPNKFGFSDDSSSVPGTVSRDEQSDTDLSASKEDVEMVASNMDKLDALFASGADPDSEDDGGIGDLMGNLHVDMEQANFPPELEKRHAALEKKWRKELDAWSGDGEDTRGPIGGDEDNTANEEEEAWVKLQMELAEDLLGDFGANEEELDSVMGNLHVDMEQANFSAAAEKRYADLEKKWQDAMDDSNPVSPSLGSIDTQTQEERDNSQALMQEAADLVDLGNISPAPKQMPVSSGTVGDVRKVASFMQSNNQISDSEAADVKDLLDQAEYFLADDEKEEAQYQYDLVRSMLELARINFVDKRKKSKQGKALTLDDQISTMQANAAILSSAYGLEAKGLDVSEAGAKMDETLRRLAELERELL